jgi:hypothetical protein
MWQSDGSAGDKLFGGSTPALKPIAKHPHGGAGWRICRSGSSQRSTVAHVHQHKAEPSVPHGPVLPLSPHPDRFWK